MGRIKSTMVKKAARQLMVGDLPFNESFEQNKRILGSSMPSKPIRNKIAGYISRLRKTKKVKAKPVAAPVEERPNDGQYI